MTLSQHMVPINTGIDSLRRIAISGLARYRFVLYLALAAVIVAGIALDLHWMTVATLTRGLVALPCMLMMFRCVRCGFGSLDDTTRSPAQ
jgi:hypothetical protein